LLFCFETPNDKNKSEKLGGTAKYYVPLRPIILMILMNYGTGAVFCI